MYKKNKTILFSVLGVTAILLTFSLLSSPSSSPSVRLLTGADFLKQYNQTSDAMLLDVRTPAEFISGHIAKAINIDFENPSFQAEIKKLDPSKTYFVYCRSGNRSGKAISLMKSAGITNIYELRGGVSGNASISLVR